MKIFFTYLILISILFGCSYSFNMNSQPHLKNLYIENFENSSEQFNLNEEIVNELTKNFIRDGRLNVVTKNNNCTLEGKIIDYKVKIETHDVTETIKRERLEIKFSIAFKDLVKDEYIYRDEALSISEIFSEYETNNNIAQSETEAREKIIEELFNTIIRNTLETW